MKGFLSTQWPNYIAGGKEACQNQCFTLSGKRVSNPRPPAWEASALPTELLPLEDGLGLEGEDGRKSTKKKLHLHIHCGI